MFEYNAMAWTWSDLLFRAKDREGFFPNDVERYRLLRSVTRRWMGSIGSSRVSDWGKRGSVAAHDAHAAMT